jgi:hypothetical protein
VRTISKQDQADADALDEANHPIPASRLNRWRLDSKAGPLSDDQAQRVEHYELLDQVLGRGGSATWAVLVMAGHGFPTEAYRTPLVKFWGVFEVDEAASPLPPFGDADNRPDAERYSDSEELSGNAITEVLLEDRSITDRDEGLGDVERAFTPFVQQVLGNLPLGDLSLALENATMRVVGFQPSDPALAPAPEDREYAMGRLTAGLLPLEARPSPETMVEAESILTHTAPIAPELARTAREEPLENLAQAAAFVFEFVQSFGLAAGDEEKARALAAVLAPGFIAVLNVLGPVAAGLLRRRGLDFTFSESTTGDSSA